ncbi:hypothetical protein BG011_009486 [Mortierella polycephala]|uniref:Histone chaperone RTT106/FACT complex subunit SPT16-like middle domain-containing protein n=1 Tax=Mortierella polycephala TaxID=41804 RepID=A0A9P6U7W2_9FUNG|nr:hypothetical protein BG011_009486 [Mortierella polycephala]
MTFSPQLVAATIQDDPELVKAVQDLVTTHPDTSAVMTRLLTYIQSKQSTLTSGPPETKRPKLDHGFAQFFNKGSASTAPATSTSSSTSSNTVSAVPQKPQDLGPAIYTTSPLSFLHPVRKKLILSLHQNSIALISATNPSESICSAPYTAVHRVVAVPFLERATKQTALILFFKHSTSLTPKDAIWAVPLADDGKDFSLQFHEQHKQLAGLTQDLTLGATTSTPVPFASFKRPDHILISILSYFLRRANPENYASNVDIVLNPTPAYPHFSAHLKSNQGTIYLLPTGILFAFRKPILFMRSDAIEAVGVHSVLSRTFDFEVVMDVNATSPEDLEGIPPENKDGRRAIGFGMVDTKEFGRMEEWIKKAGIRDRSLSEDLKAKDKAPATSSSTKKRDHSADDGEEDEADQGTGAGGKSLKMRSQADDDDDDEEDQDFAPESEDDIMEEYDSASDVEGSGSDNEGEEGSGHRGKQAADDDEEEDLEGESLGEDEDELDELHDD